MGVLPPCKYGAACYDHDGAHTHAYSHPCRYGAACYQTGKDHRHRFSHPAAKAGAAAGAAADDAADTDASSDAGAPTATGSWPCLACHLLCSVSMATVCPHCGTPRPTTTTCVPLMTEAKPAALGLAVARTSADRHRSASPEPSTPRPASKKRARSHSPSPKVAKAAPAIVGDGTDLKGANVTFTGTFAAGVRRIVEGEAGDLGVHVGSSVTRKTEMLVVGGLGGAGANKMIAADKNKVPIVKEEEWHELVKQHKSSLRKRKRAAGDEGSASTSRRRTDGGGSDDDEEEDVKLPEPLHKLEDGESVEVPSSSGDTTYKIKRVDDHYYCHCHAWRNQKNPVNQRTCKHLKAYLGAEFERVRCGHRSTGGGGGGAASSSSASSRSRAVAKPALLLANAWGTKTDPTGWWISEKFDGVRAYWTGAEFVSRQGNTFEAPDWFTKSLPKDQKLDGELFVGRGQFSKAQSVVHTVGSKHWKTVTYMIFDVPSKGDSTFEDRLTHLRALVDTSIKEAHVKLVKHTKCKGKDHLQAELKDVYDKGGEGLMLRKPGSKYVGSRSSTLLKVKTLYDAEARVVKHIRGKGKYLSDCGSLEAEMASGKTFRVGSGLSDALRKDPPKIGSIITYKFLELTSSGVPRHPVFVGVRLDVSVPKDAVIRKVTRS